MSEILLIGLDLGTQGVRAMLADTKGAVLAAASRRYARINAAESGNENSGQSVKEWKEQDAEDWKEAAVQVLADLSYQERERLQNAQVFLSVDGTSGTILPIDREKRPLRTALMYNDSRSADVVPEVRRAAKELEERLGYQIGSSFALPKILWIRENQPELFEQTKAFVHQTDYIVGCLCGEYQVSDYSNALKTGYDLQNEIWDEDMIHSLSLDRTLFPEVVAPGKEIGGILPQMAEITGLPQNTRIVSGATDGYAACIASGVVRPGQYNSTLGTTLVLKGVTKEFIRDPEGRVYCHKHPEGYWYPGGAGNVGGLCLNTWFDENRFEEYNAQVPSVVPTGNVIYPLLTKGERFPFVRPEAEGFSELVREDAVSRYAGTMEGVAYTERLCYDTLASLGCEIGDEITITGGAVKAPVWSQIRADVMGKKMVEPAVAETAFGGILFACSAALSCTVIEAAERMVRTARVFEPDPVRHREYQELYAEFCGQCRTRGYIA